MQMEKSGQWQTNVERGPGWLFVRLRQEPGVDFAAESISKSLWRLMQNHMTRRMVIEMEDVPVIQSELLGQLLELNRMIREQGGLMRLCGVSDDNRQVLERTRVGKRFPQYNTREEAVMSGQRQKPR